MRVQGYIDNAGKVVLPHIPNLGHKPIAVWVEIPDAAIKKAAEETHQNEDGASFPISERAIAMLAELAAIREAAADENLPLQLTEKQQDRWEAFELRAQLRQERGRPI